MPSTTISEVYNWSVYLLASALLLGLVAPVLNFSVDAARASETESIVRGISVQLNSLEPGLKTTLYFTTSAMWTGSVELNGHDVVGRFGHLLFVERCALLLPSIHLSPGEAYRVSTSGGLLRVEKTGFD